MRKLFLIVVASFLLMSFSSIAQAAIIFSDGFSTIAGWTLTTSNTASLTHGTPDGLSPVLGGGDYAVIDLLKNATFSMEKTISTSGYNNINLYYWRHDDSDTTLTADYKVGAGNWINLESYTSDVWQQVNWNLSSAANNSSVSIRFSLAHHDNGNHHVLGSLEDVSLIGDQITTNTVPEPATMSLLGLGLLGLMRFKRKKIS